MQRARWKFIIVHNSGTRQGNARAFDYYHRKIRRMRNGLAYHFVIGNGTSSRNGQIESILRNWLNTDSSSASAWIAASSLSREIKAHLLPPQ